MKTFTYWDNSKIWHGKQLFQCQSEDILQADEKLKEVTGIVAVKNPWVSCTVD